MYADRDDLENQTIKINGGLNGYKERLKYYENAKRVLSGGM
jgi:putative chitinase